MAELILQNPRPPDFYGPEDWTGGDWKEDDTAIKIRQERWDEAYNSLSLWERFKYRVFGFWSL